MAQCIEQRGVDQCGGPATQRLDGLHSGTDPRGVEGRAGDLGPHPLGRLEGLPPKRDKIGHARRERLPQRLRVVRRQGFFELAQDGAGAPDGWPPKPSSSTATRSAPGQSNSSGTIAGPNGNTVTHAASTSCADGSCSRTGTITGPDGGTINHSGTVTWSP